MLSSESIYRRNALFGKRKFPFPWISFKTFQGGLERQDKFQKQWLKHTIPTDKRASTFLNVLVLMCLSSRSTGTKFALVTWVEL